jgi:AcrR family transcriptional regulator
MPEPAYSRLQVDERRRQIIDAGSALFADHSYEEISMRLIAAAAGVSKPLLYHYFPSKMDLFKAAAADAAAQLLTLIEPAPGGSPAEQMTASLDAYLAWIEDHARTWTKLMQSAASLPEARELVDGFRTRTMEMMLAGLTGATADAPTPRPSPALRTAVNGWLGFMDAAILDWTRTGELTRDELRELLLTAFGGAVMAAQQIDPDLRLALG